MSVTAEFRIGLVVVRTDRALASWAADHHGIFHGGILDELGITHADRKYRTDTGRWLALHQGAYQIAGTPVTWRGELLAACWAGGTRAVASHRSAAALWELPGADRSTTEITCPRWRRARHGGLIAHETMALGPPDITNIDNIPCTTIERTIFDMCGRGGAGFADLLFDSALRRDLTTIERLIATRDRLAKRGRRGAARFRAALELRDPAAAIPESAPERMLAHMLVGLGLPTPVFQFVVRDADSRFLARADLAYPDAKVLVEYDSYQEHTGKVALVRDSARRNALVAQGWSTITATHADLRDRAHRIAGELRQLLRAAS